MSGAQWVPSAVTSGLARVEVSGLWVRDSQPLTAAGKAERAERLAELCEREARWWAVLERWTYGPAGTTPLVFGRAVIMAEGTARDEARFWRDSAADWRRRAAGEPVCGVIGCGCGGVCGVPA